MKRYFAALVLLLLAFISQTTHAANIDTEQIFAFVQQAYSAQLSLTEDFRTMDEIEDLLSPYFSNQYREKFYEEHLHEEDEGFIIYGTDVLDYVVPFYSYDATTKVIPIDDYIIITEYFPFSFGPVTGEGHYQSLVLVQQQNRLSIEQYIISEEIPNPQIIEKETDAAKK